MAMGMFHLSNKLRIMTLNEKNFIEVTDGVFIEKDGLGGAEVDCLIDELMEQGITPHITMGMPHKTPVEDLWENSPHA